MANANITEASSSVVLDTRLWMGAADNTDWLQSPIGSNSVQGAPCLLVVDLVVTAASTETTFDLTDTGITGVDGTATIAILGLHNNSGGFEAATLPHTTGSTVVFTTPAATAGDTYRLSLIYR